MQAHKETGTWSNKLWDFAREGIDFLTMAEGDHRREESKVAAVDAVVHYAPGESLLCGLEDGLEPMTPEPEWCGDTVCASIWWPNTWRTRTNTESVRR